MSASEWATWRDWYAVHGFPDERREWGTALAAEYVGATMGGKVRAAKLIPNRSSAEADDVSAVAAWFDGFVKAEG